MRRGAAIPSQEKLQVLAEWLGVEPHLLRFGEQALYSICAKRKRWDEAIGYRAREVFEAFLSLPVPQGKIVREVILTFAPVYLPEAAKSVDGEDERKPIWRSSPPCLEPPRLSGQPEGLRRGYRFARNRCL